MGEEDSKTKKKGNNLDEGGKGKKRGNKIRVIVLFSLSAVPASVSVSVRW